MLGRTSLTLLGALSTTSGGRPANLGLAGSGLGDVLVDRRMLHLPERDSGTIIDAFGGSWLVPPARAKVAGWNS